MLMSCLDLASFCASLHNFRSSTPLPPECREGHVQGDSHGDGSGSIGSHIRPSSGIFGRSKRHERELEFSIHCQNTLSFNSSMGWFVYQKDARVLEMQQSISSSGCCSGVILAAMLVLWPPA